MTKLPRMLFGDVRANYITSKLVLIKWLSFNRQNAKLKSLPTNAKTLGKSMLTPGNLKTRGLASTSSFKMMQIKTCNRVSCDYRLLTTICFLCYLLCLFCWKASRWRSPSYVGHRAIYHLFFPLWLVLWYCSVLVVLFSTTVYLTPTSVGKVLRCRKDIDP